MKKVLIAITIALCFISCSFEVTNYEKQQDYDAYVDSVVNTMKPPIVLIGISKSLGCYGVTVLDSNKKVFTIGDMAMFANRIGQSRQVGDTIIK